MVHITYLPLGSNLKRNPQKAFLTLKITSKHFVYSGSHSYSSPFDGRLVVFNLKRQKNDLEGNSEWFSSLICKKNSLGSLLGPLALVS